LTLLLSLLYTRSAYPSKEEAKKAQLQSSSAGFAPLISLEEEENMAAGMDPSIAITQVPIPYHQILILRKITFLTLEEAYLLYI
jgi:hypothetical protein